MDGEGGGAEFEEFYAIEEIEELLSYECARWVWRDLLGVGGGGLKIGEIDANEEIEEKDLTVPGDEGVGG